MNTKCLVVAFFCGMSIMFKAERFSSLTSLPETKISTTCFTLNQLYYSASEDWVVWINGKKITPTTATLDYSIRRVTPSTVIISKPFSTQNIKLQLNKKICAS